MNEQEAFWSGEGGDSYTARNRYDWRLRIPFWTKILERTGARSAYEFGCNVGYNLSAIRRAYPDVQVAGEDINHNAVGKARCAGLDVIHHPSTGYAPPPRELAFTAGVLIHIAPAAIHDFMRRVLQASSDWVLAVEYDLEDRINVDEPVEYRGRTGLLWRRDYGGIYSEMGLELIEQGEAPNPPFDRCHYWLMRRP